MVDRSWRNIWNHPPNPRVRRNEGPIPEVKMGRACCYPDLREITYTIVAPEMRIVTTFPEKRNFFRGGEQVARPECRKQNGTRGRLNRPDVGKSAVRREVLIEGAQYAQHV